MSDRPTPLRLRLREVHGHVTVSTDTMTAWFLMAPQRWSFTTDGQREALIDQYALRLATLTGRRVRIRVTSRPYPAREWAIRLHEDSPNRLSGWADHLEAAQHALAQSTLSDKVAFIGVDLKPRGVYSKVSSIIGGRKGVRNEVDLQSPELRRIADVVAGPGLGGRPATTSEIEWLLHRSVRLGLPSPSLLSQHTDVWEADDLHAFTDGVWYEQDRFSGTVAVTADYQGKHITRHVAVLTVGRMPRLRIPQIARDPWQQFTDRFPFPVEWVSTFDVLAGPEAAKATARKRQGIRDMQKQYRERGLDAPNGLDRKVQHAKQIEDETTDGSLLEAARAYGWHRLAVSGRDTEETLSRVRDVIDASAEHQMDVRHPHKIGDAAAQALLIREFIPGERLATTAYRRRLPIRYQAAGLPHVSAAIGDNRGPYMGYTSGSSRRSFLLDPHYAMEVADAAGLMPIVGGLGSGKSGLIGDLADESTQRGIVTTILDPSGPLSNLTRIPRLAKHARHIDLVDGADGLLNPYGVIPEPVRGNFDSDERYVEAVKMAEQSRKMLATDVCRMLLPPQVDAMPETPLVLSDAIRAVPGQPTSSLAQVVGALRANRRTHAKAIANYLSDMAEMPQARLFFGAGDPGDVEQVTDTLLVLTMHGIQLPNEAAPRESWSTPEQLAVPLLHLASHLATARAYGLTRHERKMVALDEAGMVGRWGSGKTLFTNLGRDTRKWNIAAPIGSQNAADVLGLNVANFISTAFVGRTEDEEHATEALRLLRIKPGEGYEQVIAGLSPQVSLPGGERKRGAREFIVKDVFGNVEKVRIDMSHKPDLLAALNTTPGRTATVEAVPA